MERKNKALWVAPFPCTRAIDLSLHAGYWSILVLMSLAYIGADKSDRHVLPERIRPPDCASRLCCQGRISEIRWHIRKRTAFWTVLRGCPRVQACRTAVCLEFAFGRLGVMVAQTFWLTQVG